MLNKYYEVEWEAYTTPEKQSAFDTMKARSTYPPVLALPKENIPYMLDGDAGKYVVGAVLLQSKAGGNPKYWATVGYLSHTLSKEHRDYAATEKVY